jgi:arabinose-5-phosphate isomerase
MHPLTAVPIVAPSTLMSEVLVSIPTGRFGCCGVMDADGSLTGIITDGDLRRHMAPDLLSRPAAEIMTAAPKTITANALAAEALGFMNRNRITGIFVVEDDQPVGFIHVHDLLQAGVM